MTQYKRIGIDTSKAVFTAWRRSTRSVGALDAACQRSTDQTCECYWQSAERRAASGHVSSPAVVELMASWAIMRL